MTESIMINKSKELAIIIVKLCTKIKSERREFVLADQLLRSGTSVGANLHESRYAHTPADFIWKMNISLKECYESEYWLELLYETGYIPKEQYVSLRNSFGTMRRMLISSIRTVRENNKIYTRMEKIMETTRVRNSK